MEDEIYNGEIRTVVQTNLDHWKEEKDIPKGTKDILILNSITRSCGLKESFEKTDWNEKKILMMLLKKHTQL